MFFGSFITCSGQSSWKSGREAYWTAWGGQQDGSGDEVSVLSRVHSGERLAAPWRFFRVWRIYWSGPFPNACSVDVSHHKRPGTAAKPSLFNGGRYPVVLSRPFERLPCRSIIRYHQCIVKGRLKRLMEAPFREWKEPALRGNAHFRIRRGHAAGT